MVHTKPGPAVKATQYAADELWAGRVVACKGDWLIEQPHGSLVLTDAEFRAEYDVEEET